MHPFRTLPRARLTCRTAFGAVDWLNLDFLAGDGDTIPFHVSLRQAEGLVVLNRRWAGAWGREVHRRVPLGPGPVTVEVTFIPGRVRVAVGGHSLGSFDALPRPDRAGRFGLRRGFPGLRLIRAVRIAGALEPGSLRLSGPRAAPAAGPVLTPELEVVWEAPPDPAPAWLVGEGLEPPEPAVLVEGPWIGRDGRPMQRLVAPLPARIWAGGAAAVAVGFDGAPPLRVDRAMVAARIAEAAGAGLWLADRRAALQAVEHARAAGLLAGMAPGLREALRRAAAEAGLDAWLFEGAALPPPPAPALDPVQAAMDDLRRQTAAALRAGRPKAALQIAGAALRDTARPREERQMLARALAEGFIHAGWMPELAALTRLAGLLPLDWGGSAWHLSTAMAFDPVQGWFGAVADRLRALAADPPGWTVTPAVGWAVAQVARLVPDAEGRAPHPDELARVVAAYLAYLDRLAGDYEGRGPCLCLIEAGVAVLRRLDRLPPDLASAACWTAVRLWGLSPRFWAALEGAVPAGLAPAEAVARAIFAAVEGGQADRAALDALLTQAVVLGMAEAPRFRRELLGPAGLPSAEPDPVACTLRGIDPGEACFRALLHPEGAGAPPAAVAAAADHVRRTWRDVPEGRHAAAERRLVAQARALLAAPEPEGLAAWAAEARHLGGAEAHGVGTALALGLAAGLARRGARAMAAVLVVAMVAAPAPAAPGAEAPALALARLARAAPTLAARAAAALGLALPNAAGAHGDPAGGREDDDEGGEEPLFDTLVCVYSCAPNLETRLPHLRATWLADLDAAGIAWRVFVGGGDGTAEGRVVRLDAPDDYEGLPDKTLAMVRWVRDRTGYARLLKVDDDCFVDVAAMFGDAALLRHPYLGRVLTRVPGQLDRTWHMAKSATARGRTSLDKSPEPSRYADGGTGYALSRGAMERLLAAAETPEGRRLRQVSMMEDKLVGDLLALAGVPVSGEDWRAAVWRRPAPGLRAVPAWEVGPMPWAGGPVRLAHLDDAAAMAAAAAAAAAPAPQRGRIWPTFVPARCGSRTNALDLVSPPERLARARAARVAVVAAVRNEAAILPLFLDHYRRLGVEAFLVADNASTDGTAAILAAAEDVAVFAAETPYAASLFGVAWQQALVAQFRLGRWSVLADADEFLVLPDDCPRLPDLLEGPDMAGFDAVRVLMLDMYPKGPLSAVTLASGDPFAETGWADREPYRRDTPVRGPFSDGETLTSALRHRLIPGMRSELFTAQKVAILRYRPWMRLTAGLHHVGEVRLAPRDLTFAHFKYTAAFRAKAEAEVRRKQHFNNAEEYQAYLTLLGEGRETLWDPEISVPWREALNR
jgi:hypothetical protein